MRLEDLLADLHPVSVSGDPEIEIAGLAFDSRRVEPGTLFVAYSGTDLDGHTYIPQAVERGAVAVVGERPRRSGWKTRCAMRG